MDGKVTKYFAFQDKNKTMGSRRVAVVVLVFWLKIVWLEKFVYQKDQSKSRKA